MKTRIMSVVLTVVMLLALVPVSAFAAGTNVAKIGNVEYATLKDAVGAVTTGSTAVINLIKDAEIGEAIDVNGNVTITGAYTIERAAGYTGTLFKVAVGATLTLDGGLVIDGGNNYKFDSSAYLKDVEDWENFTTADKADKWFTPEPGAPNATAYMITTAGTVNLNNVTIKNHYSYQLKNSYGIVSASAGAVVNLTGAKVYHCATVGGNGLVVNASGADIKVNMNEGTVIDGNHVGGNHGIFKIYSGALFTMNGGEIKNTTGWNSNGTAVGVFKADFIMNGGTICSNSSEYGHQNGRNAAIYIHNNATFTMNGGTVCHNFGRSRGGVDAPYTVEADAPGNLSTVFINNGSVIDNVSLSGGSKPDVYGGERMFINGGTFTQDVSQWLSGNLDQNADGVIGTVHSITMVNGTANVTESVFGNVISIDADDIIGGKQFMYWEVKTADGRPVQFIGGKASEITSFIMPNCDITVTAVYRAVLPMFMHSIIVVDSDYGTTSPTGIMLVMQGLSHKFTFTPDEGCEIVDVLINGESVGAVDSYRLTVNEFVNTVEAVYAPIVDAD